MSLFKRNCNAGAILAEAMVYACSNFGCTLRPSDQIKAVVNFKAVAKCTVYIVTATAGCNAINHFLAKVHTTQHRIRSC